MIKNKDEVLNLNGLCGDAAILIKHDCDTGLETVVGTFPSLSIALREAYTDFSQYVDDQINTNKEDPHKYVLGAPFDSSDNDFYYQRVWKFEGSTITPLYIYKAFIIDEHQL